MSSGSSPSLLTYLRQYRFQRRPTAAGTSATPTEPAPTSVVVRPVSISSGSTPGQYVYKRIKFQDSDSDDASSPAKRPAPSPAAPPITAAMKERRYKNMSEMFPDLLPSLIKNVLCKHNWNEERARDELLRHDPESCDIGEPASTSSAARAPVAYTSISQRPTYINGVRVAPGVTVQRTAQRPLASKGGHRRKGSDSDDSDYGVRKGRDERVYDSDSEEEVTDTLVGDKKKVFEFLNTCQLNELLQLSGCSQKKAEALVALRPFQGWLHMVQQLQECKHLNTELLNSAQELLSTRNNIQKLMKTCVGLANKLEVAVAAGAGLLGQPALLDSSLKLAPYQLVGLNWLAVLQTQGVNGILADEMGLGKTVQVIAFLAHLKESGQASGAHLVVVPASTLENWSNEFARWCPSLRISVYYGHPDERRQLRVTYAKGGLKDIDVILTTYTMVSSCPEERKMFRVTPLHYVVYDEAHMLKNMSTQRYDNLVRIKSKHRLLLTGTPLQNNLLELMSLLCFVMPHMFSGRADDLKSLFQKNSKSATKKKIDEEDDVPLFEQSQIQQAKRIMKPFVLRRLKRDVLRDLPRKTDHVELVAMSRRQNTLYRELITYFSAKDGTIHSSSEQSGVSMMMDMRKLANHPLLMRYHYTEERLAPLARRLATEPAHKETNESYVLDDLRCMSDFQIHQLTRQYTSTLNMGVPLSLVEDSGKFRWLDEHLPRLKQEGHRVLLFSQFTMMLDVIEDYMTARQHRYLRLDGSTAVVDRQELIDQYNTEDIFVFLLSTKAGGLGINLTAADTVIIHDIDFNPYNDKQAEDRCHRLGQKRPVTIYRLLSSGTIEEGIHAVAREKLNLERDITQTDENEPAEQKSVQRLLSAALGLHSSPPAPAPAPAPARP